MCPRIGGSQRAATLTATTWRRKPDQKSLPPAIVTSLASGQALEGKITSVGIKGRLQFTQDAGGLRVMLPAAAPCKYAYTIKISGLKMNPPTATVSGNPQ